MESYTQNALYFITKICLLGGYSYPKNVKLDKYEHEHYWRILCLKHYFGLLLFTLLVLRQTLDTEFCVMVRAYQKLLDTLQDGRWTLTTILVKKLVNGGVIDQTIHEIISNEKYETRVRRENV